MQLLQSVHLLLLTLQVELAVHVLFANGHAADTLTVNANKSIIDIIVTIIFFFMVVYLTPLIFIDELQTVLVGSHLVTSVIIIPY